MDGSPPYDSKFETYKSWFNDKMKDYDDNIFVYMTIEYTDNDEYYLVYIDVERIEYKIWI